MKDSVIIKSFTNGITLLLSDELSFEELLDEIAAKFSDARNFFGNAAMALSLEGRELSDTEEIRILDTIKKNCDIRIICIVGHDEKTNKNFIKALHQVEKRLSTGDEG